MKRVGLVIMVSVLGTSSTSGLPRGSFGLGVMIGEPTGLSAKYWFTRKQALDFGVAWSLPAEALHIHSTWLYHFPRLVLDPRFTPYFGLGGRTKIKKEEETRLGIRFAGGVEFVYKPFSAFLELAPISELVPETALDLEGGLGFRFYFPTQ